MPSYKDEKTGKWYCQFYYTNGDGKRTHTTKRGFLRKKDADQYEIKLKNTVQYKEITISILIDMYIKLLEQRLKLNKIKLTTYCNYTQNIRLYIRPYFAEDMPLKKLTTEDINEWLIKLKQKKATKKSNTLSSKSIGLIRLILSNILKYAVRKKYLSVSPMQDAEKITIKAKKQKQVWTFEEYMIFYNSLGKESHRIMFNLLFFGGLRIGELLALTPADVNPSGTISINHTFIILNGQKITHSPKTQYSKRVVHIPKQIHDQLTNYINRLHDIQQNERIFPCTGANIYDILTKRSKRLNLPYLSPHGLRHSNASILLKLTGDIAMLSRRLGHKDPSITLQVYSHMLPGADEDAAKELDQLISTNNISTIDVDN